VQTAYRYWVTIIFIAVIVQVSFAGYGAFSVANDVDEGTVGEDRFEDVFGLHAGLGYPILLAALILLVIALIARLGKRRVWHTAGLFGLLVLQVLLAWFGFEVPAIGALHPVNALAIFTLSGWLARTAWRGDGVPAAA
jgi:Family of unknown function (DUF6220)